jgi:hypothetical protein
MRGDKIAAMLELINSLTGEAADRAAPRKMTRADAAVVRALAKI